MRHQPAAFRPSLAEKDPVKRIIVTETAPRPDFELTQSCHMFVPDAHRQKARLLAKAFYVFFVIRAPVRRLLIFDRYLPEGSRTVIDGVFRREDAFSCGFRQTRIVSQRPDERMRIQKQLYLNAPFP